MNIIELAKKAGFEELYGWKDDGSCEISYELFVTDLERFAALVRAEREWVDLTDDEIEKIVDDKTSDDCGYDIWCDGYEVARAVIAAFKEKNK